MTDDVHRALHDRWWNETRLLQSVYERVCHKLHQIVGEVKRLTLSRIRIHFFMLTFHLSAFITDLSLVSCYHGTQPPHTVVQKDVWLRAVIITTTSHVKQNMAGVVPMRMHGGASLFQTNSYLEERMRKAFATKAKPKLTRYEITRKII